MSEKKSGKTTNFCLTISKAQQEMSEFTIKSLKKTITPKCSLESLKFSINTDKNVLIYWRKTKNKEIQTNFMYLWNRRI